MAGRLRGYRGGIAGLLGLIDQHRGALEYDFRNRLHIPLTEVGVGVGLDEAVRLVQVLRSDPGTQLAASVEQWDYPTDRNTAVMMDLFDLEHAKAGVKNATPYPRAWKPLRQSTKYVPDASLTADEIQAALYAMGHRKPLPTVG